jgi:ABC-type maltose transport system permease subunit
MSFTIHLLDTNAGIILLYFKGKQMAKRFITRIELENSTRKGLDEATERNGMTQVALLSRVVAWFTSQPKDVQIMILGLVPDEISPDVATVILKRMAESKVA